MKTINRILESACEDTLGAFRLQAVKKIKGRSGKAYLSCRLEDATGVLPAMARFDHRVDKDALVSGKRMLCQIRLHYRDGEPLAEILSATQWVAGLTNPVALLPQSSCPQPDSLLDLVNFRESLASKALQAFIDTVLQQDSIALPFISAPGSLNHHHSEPGGLLQHSLECSDIVGRLGSDQSELLELGQVAALFHDIGKIKTLTNEMERTQLGYVVDHNALTLEMLAPALVQLEKRWPDGATALRYILTWHHHPKPGNPLMVMAEVVRSADRISSGQSIQNKAFANALPWQQGAKIESLPYPQRFWRPRHLPQSEARS